MHETIRDLGGYRHSSGNPAARLIFLSLRHVTTSDGDGKIRRQARAAHRRMQTSQGVQKTIENVILLFSRV
jgi:hypothetical protein